LNVVLNDGAVNHDLNVMLVFFVQRGRFFDVLHLAIGVHAGVA
jgi:hypothetical protein